MKGQVVTRILALWLSVSLAAPQSAWGLRVEAGFESDAKVGLEQTLDASGLEEVAGVPGALQIPVEQLNMPVRVAGREHVNLILDILSYHPRAVVAVGGTFLFDQETPGDLDLVVYLDRDHEPPSAETAQLQILDGLTERYGAHPVPYERYSEVALSDNLYRLHKDLAQPFLLQIVFKHIQDLPNLALAKQGGVVVGEPTSPEFGFDPLSPHYSGKPMAGERSAGDPLVELAREFTIEDHNKRLNDKLHALWRSVASIATEDETAPGGRVRSRIASALYLMGKEGLARAVWRGERKLQEVWEQEIAHLPKWPSETFDFRPRLKKILSAGGLEEVPQEELHTKSVQLIQRLRAVGFDGGVDDYTRFSQDAAAHAEEVLPDAITLNRAEALLLEHPESTTLIARIASGESGHLLLSLVRTDKEEGMDNPQQVLEQLNQLLERLDEYGVGEAKLVAVRYVSLHDVYQVFREHRPGMVALESEGKQVFFFSSSLSGIDAFGRELAHYFDRKADPTDFRYDVTIYAGRQKYVVAPGVPDVEGPVSVSIPPWVRFAEVFVYPSDGGSSDERPEVPRAGESAPSSAPEAGVRAGAGLEEALGSPTAGLEEFRKPVSIDQNSFQAKLDFDLSTSLNRDLRAEAYFTEVILPVLVSRNHSTRTITLADLGVSTGEAVARRWHFASNWMMEHGRPLRGENRWTVKIFAVEQVGGLIEKGKSRFKGDAPFVYLLPRGAAGMMLGENIYKLALSIADTVKRDQDLIHAKRWGGVRWINGDMTRAGVMNRIKSADAIFSFKTTYWMREDERIEFWTKLMEKSPNAWFLTGDKYLLQAAEALSRRSSTLEYRRDIRELDGGTLDRYYVSPPAPTGLEEPESHPLLTEPVANQLNSQGFSRQGKDLFIDTGRYLSVHPERTFSRAYLHTGLEEIQDLSAWAAVVPLKAGTPAEAIKFFNQEQVQPNDVIFFNTAIFNSQQITAASPLVTPPPGVIGLPENTPLAADEAKILADLAQQFGPIYIVNAVRFISQTGETILLIQAA